MTGAHSFGRYRVTGTLGSGAMGEVYAAVDEVLGREVAVKTLRGQASGLAARFADERFRMEARAIAALTHPSVVQVFDIDLTAEPPYLVMERVAGPSLKDRLREGPLAEPSLRALGIQIANALAAAHARGVVHRDVKPANILAAGSDTWKLADFGVAHVPDSSITFTGQFVGSPAYAAPEALVRGQLGPEGDVFSLGATLYEAAAGVWPRAQASTVSLLAPAPPLREHAPGLAPELAAAIDRAVSVEPVDRPSAAELAMALAGASGQIAAVAASASGAMASGAMASGAMASASGAMPSATAPGTPTVATVALPSGTGSMTSTGTAGGTGTAAGAGPAAAPSFRWKHIIAGTATLLAIALIAAARCSPSGPSGGKGSAIVVEPGERGELPSELHVVAPPIRDQRAAKDWKKIMDKLRKQQFGEARRKLADWERNHGETTETRNLASQLDSLPPEALGGPGRGRGRDEDD